MPVYRAFRYFVFLGDIPDSDGINPPADYQFSRGLHYFAFPYGCLMPRHFTASGITDI
jgi:hypothetical protein